MGTITGQRVAPPGFSECVTQRTRSRSTHNCDWVRDSSDEGATWGLEETRGKQKEEENKKKTRKCVGKEPHDQNMSCATVAAT